MVFGNRSKLCTVHILKMFFLNQVEDCIGVSVPVIRLKVIGQGYGNTFTRQQLIFLIIQFGEGVFVFLKNLI